MSEQGTTGVTAVKFQDMTDGAKCLAFFSTLYGGYESLPGAEQLRGELRCLIPKHHMKAGQFWGRQADAYWFELNRCGYWQAARYVALNRDTYDIISSIHPRLGESFEPGASPYFNVLAVDLDAKGDRGGPRAADTHFVKMVNERGLQLPHMALSGLNGLHLYFLLSQVVDMSGEEGRSAYQRLAKRLCRAVSGPPDQFTERGRPIWDGPFADDGPTVPEATLRPAGSYNHGGGANVQPSLVELIYYRPQLLRHPLDWWKNEAGLPRLREDAPLPEEFRRRKQFQDDGLLPHERKPIPFRTRLFLLEGADGNTAENHQRLLTSASDLAYAGYTQEEATDLLLMHVSRGRDDEDKIRSMIYRSPGRKFLWNDTPCGRLPEIRTY